MMRLMCSSFVVVLGACQLPAAAFGRACTSSADCVDDSGNGTAALTCNDGQCVTADYLDRSGPDAGPDPDVVPGGETCADAIPLALNVDVQGTTGDALDKHDALCAGDNGADRAYVVTLAAVGNLRVSLTGNFDGALYASTNVSCAFDTVIPGGCVDAQSNVTEPEVLELFGVGPGQVFIVVDGANQLLLANSGTYTIRATADLTCTAGFNAIGGQCLGIVQEVTQVVARTNATATLLDDGRVLVTGGRTGASLDSTATAEVFNPATNTFTATGSMSTARARHVAERLEDGRVVVVGGATIVGGAATPTATVEVWDPQTDVFSAAPSLPRRRDLTTATQLGGGRGILVMGGRDGASTLNDILVLDPALTAWTAHGTLNVPRFGHLTTMFDNGDEVLVVGGRAGSTARALDSVESFDPQQLTVSSGSSSTLLSARAAASGALASPRRFVVFGGYEGDTDNGFVGKASVETFQHDGDWNELFADMQEPRLFATATVVPRLGIVVAGGSQDDPTASMELYVDANERFELLPPLHHARLAHAAVALLDGRVLFVGGDGGNAGNTTPLAQAELFGPQP